MCVVVGESVLLLRHTRFLRVWKFAAVIPNIFTFCCSNVLFALYRPSCSRTDFTWIALREQTFRSTVTRQRRLGKSMLASPMFAQISILSVSLLRANLADLDLLSYDDSGNIGIRSDRHSLPHLRYLASSNPEVLRSEHASSARWEIYLFRSSLSVRPNPVLPALNAARVATYYARLRIIPPRVSNESMPTLRLKS